MHLSTDAFYDGWVAEWRSGGVEEWWSGGVEDSAGSNRALVVGTIHYKPTAYLTCQSSRRLVNEYRYKKKEGN